MSVSVARSDDNKLESVLQHIFAECGVCILVSSPCSTRHEKYVGDKVQISRIIEYIQNQLPTWPVDRLAELRKYLVAVSSNDYVNLQQFREATKYWIFDMQQTRSLQDDNNNMQERFDTGNVMYANCNILSDADSSLKTAVKMDRDVIEFELRMKLRELQEENNLLHDELERHEAVIDNLKLQYGNAKKQLDRYVQTCQQLEKENDEQREELNKVILKEKTTASTLQRCTKEKENLTKRVEVMEVELQTISALEEKIEKLNKEKTDAMKQVIRLQEEIDEKENECKYLRIVMAELEDTSIGLKKSYEYTINNLREQNRQLADENTELQSLSMFNQYPSSEKLSLSPPITDGHYTHSTPYKCTTKVLLQESLYTELKASGFVAGCANDSCKQELDEEYNDNISTVLEQLEKIIQICVTMWSSSNDIPDFNPQDSNAHNIEALKRKTNVLLNMATEEFTKKSAKDASTQLRADPADATETFAQFGVPCFQYLSPARTQPYLETEKDWRSIVSHQVNGINVDDDSFSRIIRAHAGSQNRFRTIDPIVKELHEIIENTLVTLANRKEHSPPRSSRCRLVHTLPSCPQSLPLSNAENSMQQESGHQDSKAESFNSVFARGDVQTRENGDVVKFLPFVTESRFLSRNNSNKLDGDQTNEMWKVGSSALQVVPQKLAMLKEEINTAKTYQVPEVSSASNPASPRRKISVYCRSFDMAAVQDSREDPQRGSGLEARQLPSEMSDDSCAQIDEKIDKVTTDVTFGCSFNYRSTRNISDSSTDSTPTKSFGDSLPDDESPCKRSLGRTICLAPVRLKLPRKIENDLNETPATSKRAFPVADSIESDVALLSSTDDSEREKDNVASVHSSATFIVDKCKTEVKEDPHSLTNTRRVGSESQLRVKQSVDSQMSSREDSSDSGSELEPAAESGDQCAKRVVNKTDTTAGEVSGPAFARIISCKNVVPNSRQTHNRNGKRKAKGQRVFMARRSFSEGENNGRSKCRCRQDVQSASSIPEENQFRAFPSLTDVRASRQESDITNSSDTELNSRENLSELEMQKKYTAFSLCLCVDRLTLPQRVAISLQQRDQSEKNFLREMEKVKQNIQDLVRLLCADRESVERVERIRHQLDMIAQCAHRVSCTAETLGAVHQECRVARAVLLTDKYVRMVLARCEKLAANVAETKRILTENNIVIEENSGELSDDLPRIRYRSGTCANNRMMMTKRRASVATMSRPMGNTQDVTKDTVRQRNSVCGRMTLRRPSFSAESPKWETEKLNHNNSNSISELRGIFEQTESRRNSREENDMIRLSQFNSQSAMNCSIVEKEMNINQETCSEFLSANDDSSSEYNSCARSLHFRLRNTSWRAVLWSIVIFFLGFFVNQALSMMNNRCPLNSWSIEQILSRYIQIRNAAPHPM
ncbi:uncharacterized protein LOC109854705 isoform X4 [Pseudomyrmex gracilis]|uniref:uncharacterized protein LOC109854705 isoform X4 n=1 Tax=Pseudomyrmex gracilis TaxID=219809 RepID=UPI00099593BB|nr:uncharacterized protein LOC109854705 isoform X4 [Pseudomyrmex gracilis]